MIALRSPSQTSLTVLGVSVLLVATGCSTSSSAPSAVDSTGGVDWQAQVEDALSMDATAREAEARSLSASIDRQLMTMSGLEKELGGATAADAAYAELSAAMLKAAQSSFDQQDFGRFGAHVVAADTPSMGGMMVTNLIIVALGADAAVAVTNDLKPGETLPPSTPKAESGGDEKAPGTFTVSGTTEKAQLEAGAEMTAGGVTGKVKTVVTVAPCPDANGQFTATTTMTSSIAKAGASTGANLTVEVTVTGQVDDDAHLAASEMEMRTQSAQFESGKGQFVDISLSWSETDGKAGGYKGQMNRTGGNVTEEFALAQLRMGILMAIAARDKAMDAAQKGWESGRCVTINVTTTPGKRTGLKPSTAVSVLAAPVSKIDGHPTGGTVTANLSGGTSVDPAGSKVPADATFAYVAPGEKDKTATVSLEARSKRGVAKEEVAFDTKSVGYFIRPTNGGSITVKKFGSFSGLNWVPTSPMDICDIGKPFTLAGPLGTTQEFTPTDSDGGTTSYSTAGSGIPMSAKGTYAVDLGGAKLTTKMKGIISFPGSPTGFSGKQVFILDPPEGTCS